MRKLLYIDTSYTLEQIRQRKLDHVLRIRLLDGYFDQAWSTHPVDTQPDEGASSETCGPPLFEQVADNHVFIRGRYGRFPWLQGISKLNALLALVSLTWTLVRLARRERVDVIRASNPLLCGLIGVIAARLSGARLVVRISGNHDTVRAKSGAPIMPRLFRRVWIEERVERYVLERTDLVLSPSADYTAYATDYGAAPERVHLVRYGNLIDPAHLMLPDEREPLADAALAARLRERPWLVHVGRLDPVKHAEDCLGVLEHLAAAGSDAGLCLVGDGPLRETMADRAAQAGLQDRILFLGNIDQTFLARLLPYCTIVLSPLTGRALAETSFAARPVVAYDLDWQGELIETDVTGILVPGHDVAAMAAGAKRFLDDPAYARAMGAALRERALIMLSPDEQTRREVDAHIAMEQQPRA